MSRSAKYYLWLLRNWFRGDYEGGRISWGQHGEDILLWEALHSGIEQLPQREVRYLDIGANHPSKLSNTMYAYQRGDTGVLVEPNPILADLLRKRRPKDTILDFGISASSSPPIRFYVFSPDVLSTFSDKTAKDYVRLGYTLVEELEVPVVGINEIITDYFPKASPHIFSLDVEGFDEQIIAAIDWTSFRPVVICVETWDMGVKREMSGIIERVKSAGYSTFAKLGPNTIFLQN